MFYHVLASLDHWYARTSPIQTDALVEKSQAKPSGINFVKNCQRRAF